MLHPTLRKQMNKLGKQNTPFLFILDFEGSEKSKVIPIDDFKNSKEIQFNLHGITNHKPHPSIFNKKIDLKKTVISFEHYKKAFQFCQKEINYGNSYLLNLTFPTAIRINLSLEEIYQYSQARYKLFVKDHFVCFSPETFIKIQNGVISSNPMKGTISTKVPNAEQVILADEKEFAEHATIVDLIRNDLNRVAKKVKVERFRYLEKIQTHDGGLIQVSSKITGVLPNDYSKNIGNILSELLPAGSITGAPKSKTIEIIQEAEQYERGFYTGIVGCFDGENLDSAVMIRFIEKQHDQLYFKSGGGITNQSIAEKEYQELMNKVYVPIPTPVYLETIRVENRELQHIFWHNQRLNDTRKALFQSTDQWDLKTLIEIPEDLTDEIYKCRVTYSTIIHKIEFEPYRVKTIQSLKIVEANGIDYTFKGANRSELHDLYQQKENCDDILIIKNGSVTDTYYCNIAFFDGKEWWTSDSPLLNGTHRRMLLEDGILKEKRILVEDLQNFKGFKIFNAMMNWEEQPILNIQNIKM